MGKEERAKTEDHLRGVWKPNTAEATYNIYISEGDLNKVTK